LGCPAKETASAGLAEALVVDSDDTCVSRMDKTTLRLAIGLGVVAAGHYALTLFIPHHGDGPDSPPLASITALSTNFNSAQLSGFNHITLDAITDAEYAQAKPGAGQTVTVFHKA
jgi:hypothetical protein